MAILDTTVVNVAIQHLTTDFDAPLSTIQWVVTGYMLALATVIPLTGWAAHRFGTKRLYMISLCSSSPASALCGMAWSAESLIGFRVLQGLGGGMIMPAGHDDPHAGRRPAADRPRHGDRRRADAARPDRRPDPRRLARRRRLLALDLLHQRADRRGRARRSRCADPAARTSRSPTESLDWRRPRAALAGPRGARSTAWPRSARTAASTRPTRGCRSSPARLLHRRVRRGTRCAPTQPAHRPAAVRATARSPPPS